MKIGNYISVFLLQLLVLTTSYSLAHANQVNDIRVGKQQEATRFVLELEQPVPFRMFTLNNPERLVVDIPDIAWKVTSTPKLAGTAIKQYRTGLFKQGITRIVLDLNGPVALVRNDSLAESNKFRIILDIAPITAKKSEIINFETSDWNAYFNQKNRVAEQKQEQKQTVKKKKPVIVLDAGHGGIDPGGVVPGVREKDIVLSFAKLLKGKIEAQGKYKTVLTRDKDVYVPLRDRFKIAEKADADMFISIHADKIHVKSIRGLTIYTLSEKASDDESAALAQQANRADILVGHNVNEYDSVTSDILIDRALEATTEQSWRIAKLMVRSLKGQVPISRKPHRFAGFAVLKSPNVPSILIELGYLTNESDFKNLRSKNFKNNVSDKLILGIDAYFKELAGQ